MLRLLLVDDEASTREGLVEFIPWKQTGIETLLTAQNGEDAINIAYNERPDILLTDIRMPNMNGIELVERIKEFLPNCKIIFISGFADKEYLKSAIKLNAVSYVEKPIDIEEITSAVAQAVALCRKDTEWKKYETYISEKIAQSIPFLKQKLGTALVKSRAKIGTVHADLKEIGFDVCRPWSYITFAIKCKPMEIMDQDRLALAMEEFLKQALSKDCIKHVFAGFIENNLIILHTAFENCSRNTVQSFAKSITEQFKIAAGCDMPVSVAVGRSVKDIKDIVLSYEEAIAVVKKFFFYNYNSILGLESDGGRIYEPDIKLLDSFSSFISKDDKNKAVGLVKKVCFDTAACPGTSVDKIKRFFLNLCLIVEAEAEKRGIALILGMDKAELAVKISKMDTVFDIADYLNKGICDLYELIEKKNRSGRSIYEIIKYIEENYNDSNLMVKTIADYAHYSHFHFCSLFKKSTGMTLNDYISKVRIAKAKEMLKDKKVKLYEISKSIGYSNSNYFIRVFKKYEGCTPSDFREKYYI